MLMEECNIDVTHVIIYMVVVLYVLFSIILYICAFGFKDWVEPIEESYTNIEMVWIIFGIVFWPVAVFQEGRLEAYP